MAYWGFGYNVPLVINNFLYLMLILITAAGVAVGVYAAMAHKKAEASMPADAEYEKKLAARKAKKGKAE